MNVALIGYGKMGKAIESFLVERGHEVIAKFGSKGIDLSLLKKADVAIEFTRPEVAYSNIETCLCNNIPVVIGTTGWLKHYAKATKLCKENNSAMLYASNFSLGVNLFFALNTQLAKMMSNFNTYKVDIQEIHHTEKLDAPSGTAISLAEQITTQLPSKNGWTMDNPPSGDKIYIEALREAGVPGTHCVQYQSEIDTIEIKHTAHSRKGFALGAVIAAEFLYNKQGVFEMKDVLKLNL